MDHFWFQRLASEMRLSKEEHLVKRFLKGLAKRQKRRQSVDLICQDSQNMESIRLLQAERVKDFETLSLRNLVYLRAGLPVRVRTQTGCAIRFRRVNPHGLG